MEWLSDPAFWLAVGQIILIDILLGGDNAVVIALACRRLSPDMRRKGIFWGTAGAIGLRVVLIFFALTLLKLPALKLIGALLLVWIGVKLMLPEDDGHGDIEASDKLWSAVKTIIVADLVMSVDNVIAIAGAAQGAGNPNQQMFLVVFGLLVSIPIIVWGSQLVIKLMDRFPIIITLGAMLLGWIAGGLLLGDPLFSGLLPADMPRWWSWVAGAIGAGVVWLLGVVLQRRQRPSAVQD
jgi:YjbE family integral membrane protein